MAEATREAEELQDPEWEAAWLAEIERRERGVQAGETQGSEWPEVRARLVARLTAR